MLKVLNNFWERCPLLYYALIFLATAGWVHTGEWACLIPLVPLLFSNRRYTGSFLFLAVYLYAQPYLPTGDETGAAYVEFVQVAERNHRGQKLIYKGTIKTLGKFKNIPFIMSFKGNSGPDASSHYVIEGKLKKLKSHYVFFPDRLKPWKKVKNTFTLANARYHSKKWIAGWIEKGFVHKAPAELLKGLATGDLDDDQLKRDFSRFGLQHILAISGFHFTILSSLLGLLLGVFIPRRALSITLAILLTAYFLIVGPSASVMRAWTSFTLFMLAGLLARKGEALNALGLAMIVILTLDPSQALSIGFIFSFSSTASLLLFTALFDDKLKAIFIPRSLNLYSTYPYSQQIGLMILVFLRKAIALNVAVSLTALPLTLAFFQKFPLWSLYYNLFFPFLISFSLLFLILAIAIPPFHWINSYYTNFILNLLKEFPSDWNGVLQSPPLPLYLIMLWVTFIYIWGIYKNLQLKYAYSSI